MLKEPSEVEPEQMVQLEVSHRGSVGSEKDKKEEERSPGTVEVGLGRKPSFDDRSKKDKETIKDLQQQISELTDNLTQANENYNDLAQ